MKKRGFEGIEEFFPLVEKIARKYAKRGVDIDDLRQQGMIGLLNAFQLYDENRKETFGVFVSKHIDGAIKHYLRDKVSIIKYPRWFKTISYKIDKFILEFKEKYNRFPNVEEISEALNIQEKGVREFFRLRGILYVQSIDGEEDSLNFNYNLLKEKLKHREYESFKLPIEDIITLYSAIDKLSDLKKKVINYLFFQGYTQKEAADKIGISQRHLSRLKKQALNELKDKLKD